MSEPVGAVATLSRFPVKSMQGERLTAAELTERGIVGDRAYALVETETGKVMSAKNPRLGPQLLGCRAAYVEAPKAGDESPPVRITLPDGTAVTSDRARRRRHPLRLLRTAGHAAARCPRGLHDRSVPPRRRRSGPRGAPRHRHRVEAGRGVLRPSRNPVAGRGQFVLRSVPRLRADDVDPRPAAGTSSRESLRRAPVPHERRRGHA